MRYSEFNKELEIIQTRICDAITKQLNGKKPCAIEDSVEDNPTDITDAIFNPKREYDFAYFNIQWNYYRLGSSYTKLPDGRIIMIGGEYDDYYDPNFFIYNDVIVLANDKITIYEYPTETFPATDFHKALLIDNYIWLFGSIGYNSSTKKQERIQVCRLDINTMKMELIKTIGDSPLWMCFREPHQKCYLQGSNEVIIEHTKNKWMFNITTLVWNAFY